MAIRRKISTGEIVAENTEDVVGEQRAARKASEYAEAIAAAKSVEEVEVKEGKRVQNQPEI